MLAGHFRVSFVHLSDLVLEMSCDGIAFQLAVSGQQPALDGKRLAAQVKSANLFVVRQIEIHGTKSRLNGIFSYRAAYDGRKISTSVAHDQHLERAWNLLQELVFNRLGCHVVSGTQDNQIL